MLRAALEVLAERGFPDTRIADVAARAAVSPALVIYYFKTKDNLLGEAIGYAEDIWYEEGARRMGRIETAAGRLEEIVAMSCLPQRDDDPRRLVGDLARLVVDGCSPSAGPPGA